MAIIFGGALIRAAYGERRSPKILGSRGNGDTAAFPQWRLKSRPFTHFNREQKTRRPAFSEWKRTPYHQSDYLLTRTTTCRNERYVASCPTSRAGLRHVPTSRCEVTLRAADFRGPPIWVNILCGWDLAATWLRISVRRVVDGRR